MSDELYVILLAVQTAIQSSSNNNIRAFSHSLQAILFLHTLRTKPAFHVTLLWIQANICLNEADADKAVKESAVQLPLFPIPTYPPFP